ncbi:MAG: hypothetical protein ACQKBV_14020 [Puniceicoccales bacterium]
MKESLSTVTKRRSRFLPRRLTFTLPVDGGASVRWTIRPLQQLDETNWVRGFPYFGDIAEILESWGLYSRSAILTALKERTGLPLGDNLLHCVRGGRVLIADISNGWVHRVGTDLWTARQRHS